MERESEAWLCEIKLTYLISVSRCLSRCSLSLCPYPPPRDLVGVHCLWQEWTLPDGAGISSVFNVCCVLLTGSQTSWKYCPPLPYSNIFSSASFFPVYFNMEYMPSPNQLFGHVTTHALRCSFSSVAVGVAVPLFVWRLLLSRSAYMHKTVARNRRKIQIQGLLLKRRGPGTRTLAHSLGLWKHVIVTLACCEGCWELEIVHWKIVEWINEHIKCWMAECLETWNTEGNFAFLSALILACWWEQRQGRKTEEREIKLFCTQWLLIIFYWCILRS